MLAFARAISSGRGRDILGRHIWPYQSADFVDCREHGAFSAAMRRNQYCSSSTARCRISPR